jgi:anti-sigma28 factor (negative regulator of flagellin synthesis)
MKISENQIPSSVAPPGAATTASTANVAAAPPPAKVAPDRVTTDEARHFRSSVAREVNMAAGERAMRLQALTLSIAAGTYHPDTSRLAGVILAEAKFDAALAQSLG